MGGDAALTSARDLATLSDPTSSDADKAQAWRSLGTSGATFGLPTLARHVPERPIGRRGSGSAIEQGITQVQSIREGTPTNRASRINDNGLRTNKGLAAPDVPWTFGWLEPDLAGSTGEWGNITINRNLIGDENKIAETLRHEAVHRFLTPKPRTGKMMSNFTRKYAKATNALYSHSELARAVEETLAEWYATGSLLEGIRHPFAKKYDVTPLGVGIESLALGTGLSALTVAGYRGGTDLANSIYDDPGLKPRP